MEQPGLMSLVRPKIRALLASYVRDPEITERIDEYVVSPALGKRVGAWPPSDWPSGRNQDSVTVPRSRTRCRGALGRYGPP